MSLDYTLLPGSPHWRAGGVVTWYYAGAAAVQFNQQIAAGYAAPDFFPTELAAAFSLWSQVANVHFQQTTNPASANITIGWANVDGPFGILAQTNYSTNPSTGLFNSAQINFDDRELYNPTSGTEVLAGGVTFESVALHEIGHALGLAHYDSAPAIMNSFAHASVNALTQSDIDGIVAIYGPSTASSTNLVASIQSDYLAIIRSTVPLTQAIAIATSIEAGTTTEAAYINSLLAQAANTTIPAVAVEASMYGAVGTSTEVTALATQFLPAQVASALIHGYNPQVYASEALGLAFAFSNENGSTAFANNFGPFHAGTPNTVAGDAAFAAAASIAIFGAASTPTLVTAIQNYVANWKALFESNGTPGFSHPTADQIDLAARGAAWGDAVGLALANNLGILANQVTNFLTDAAQGKAIYSASLASQPDHGTLQSTPPTALLGNPVDLTGVAASLDHSGLM
jgi:Matrixin